MPVIRPICNGTRKCDGLPCQTKSQPGQLTCGRHKPRDAVHQQAGFPPEQQCSYFIHKRDPIRRRQCPKHALADDVHLECRTHQVQRQRRNERRQYFRRVMHIYRHFAHQLWQFEFENRNNARENIPFRTIMVRRIMDIAGNTEPTAEHVQIAIDLWRIEHVDEEQPGVTELQRIALDNQSVHTRPVTELTNKNIELLFAIPYPSDQETMHEIRVAWTRLFHVPGRGVKENQYDDMQRWYDTETCRTSKDWMYRRVLDHLWARIKLVENTELRRELMKRLQQETAESYGMCCDGHIARLANVMCGFDEAFTTTVPVGEILQQKMAVISRIEDVEERFLAATALFAELGLTMEQAGPWLDAIGEEDT